MNTPIERLMSTFTIAGILFMAPLMVMARIAMPMSPLHRAPIAQKRVTSAPANPQLAAGETESSTPEL
jgi:hypothetical protein